MTLYLNTIHQFRSTGIECGDKYDYYSNLGINYIFQSKKLKLKDDKMKTKTLF